MNSCFSLARIAILCGWLSVSPLVFADITASGEQIFQDNCNICHNGEDPKAPGISALETLNSRFVLDALTKGKMRMQGASLSDKDKEVLVSWLGRKISLLRKIRGRLLMPVAPQVHDIRRFQPHDTF